jgi:hypothetical protein
MSIDEKMIYICEAFCNKDKEEEDEYQSLSMTKKVYQQL